MNDAGRRLRLAAAASALRRSAARLPGGLGQEQGPVASGRGGIPGGSSGRLLARPPLCYRGLGLRVGHFDVPAQAVQVST